MNFYLADNQIKIEKDSFRHFFVSFSSTKKKYEYQLIKELAFDKNETALNHFDLIAFSEAGMLFGLFSNFQAFLKILIRDEIISFSLKWVLVPTSVQLRLSSC